MKIFSLIIFNFFLFSLCNGQIVNQKVDFKFQDDKIYLVYRGTMSKRKLVAEDFNLKNPAITHIGLGILINGKEKIFNVSNDKKVNGSSLVIDSLESFFYNSNDIFYGCIYFKAVNSVQKEKLKKQLAILNKHRIVFDKKFQLSNNDTLYCSEFVVKILVNIFGFVCQPVKLKLENYFYKKYFNSDFLIYYPVDYFVNDTRFKKCYELFFN